MFTNFLTEMPDSEEISFFMNTWSFIVRYVGDFLVFPVRMNLKAQRSWCNRDSALCVFSVLRSEVNCTRDRTDKILPVHVTRYGMVRY